MELVPWDQGDLVREKMPPSQGIQAIFHPLAEIQETGTVEETIKKLALQCHLLENRKKISYFTEKENVSLKKVDFIPASA